MKKIIEDNYKSIVDRGLIAPNYTTGEDFFVKLREETTELIDAYYSYDENGIKEELADVIMVCLNMAKHYKINIEQEIKNKIEINKQRAKNEK